MALFPDRRNAAAELARLLGHLKDERPIVLGIANSGVPMAEVIANALDAPMDVLLIERLRAPKNPDHFVGAVDEHGRISMIKSTARWHHLTSQQMVGPAREIFRDLRRKCGRMRAILPELDVRGRTVILVSQGVATGAKMLGAISSVRDRGARKIVVAAPAGSGEAAWQLNEAAHLVVIPHRPAKFKGVREFYEDFTEVTEDLMFAVVEQWVRRHRPQQEGVKTLVMKVTNDAGHLICCEIDLPPGTTRGGGPFPTVVFAHGYESDGRNPRTVPTSRRLAKRGLIGVRLDFTGHGRSEGELTEATETRMAADLRTAIKHLSALDEVDETRLGLVGSGSGSLLVLDYARSEPAARAVVVRGPMCGMEIAATTDVPAPTLVVYAALDHAVSDEERASAARLPSFHQTLEIPDSTRLFGDAISREMMVSASVDWLVDHLTPLPGTGTDVGDRSETEAGADAGAEAEAETAADTDHPAGGGSATILSN